ncbi:MAG TPA: hypothetical protein VFH06_04825 [Candidatus Saccharimonadales bacterium]|nr:hypothetical protein [Candidatus Saccharimonadales bacterium]
MNIWPERAIPLKSTVWHREDKEMLLAEDNVKKVREELATMGSSLSEPVMLGGGDGHMLGLIALGLDAITGHLLLLRVTNEPKRSYPVLRLMVAPYAATGRTERALYPHEVGVKLDSLEQRLREALGDAINDEDED